MDLDLLTTNELLQQILDLLIEYNLVEKFDLIIELLGEINQLLVNLIYLASAFFLWKVISIIYKLFNDIFR